MLAHDEHLSFLLSKVESLQIALFRAEIRSVLQLPNNIISTLKTDKDGHIWFFTSCSGNHAKSIDREFYGCLDYYQKGRDCRLQLSGKASIVEDSDHIDAPLDPLGDNIVLIKFKILKAEYFENKHVNRSTFREKISSFITDLFIEHSHREFDFSERVS